MSIRSVLKSTVRLARNGSGATSIEYALLAAVIAIAIIASLQAIGGQIRSTFSDVASGFGSATE